MRGDNLRRAGRGRQRAAPIGNRLVGSPKQDSEPFSSSERDSRNQGRDKNEPAGK